jgi:hypothetical protein
MPVFSPGTIARIRAATTATGELGARCQAMTAALGAAVGLCFSADPDEPLWFDAMRHNPDDSEEWTP